MICFNFPTRTSRDCSQTIKMKASENKKWFGLSYQNPNSFILFTRYSTLDGTETRPGITRVAATEQHAETFGSTGGLRFGWNNREPKKRNCGEGSMTPLEVKYGPVYPELMAGDTNIVDGESCRRR